MPFQLPRLPWSARYHSRTLTPTLGAWMDQAAAFLEGRGAQDLLLNLWRSHFGWMKVYFHCWRFLFFLFIYIYILGGGICFFGWMVFFFCTPPILVFTHLPPYCDVHQGYRVLTHIEKGSRTKGKDRLKPPPPPPPPPAPAPARLNLIPNCIGELPQLHTESTENTGQP